MSGLSEQEQLEWRLLAEKSTNDDFRRALFVNPPEYYSYFKKEHHTELEIMRWELEQIRSSDVVLLNLDGINDSVGTHIELGYINAINSTQPKTIFVVAFGGNDFKSLHPWIRESIFRHEPTMNAAINYIVDYILL